MVYHCLSAVNCYSTGQKTPNFYEIQSTLLCRKSLQLEPILREISPIHIFTMYYCKMHYSEDCIQLK
jgi:hypothetical protein